MTWDGAGNVGPALAVAAELRSRGHRVDVLGHDSTADTIASAGVEFHRFPTGRQWSADRPSQPLQMIAMFGDRGLGADVVDHIRRNGADVVVVDCLLFGVMDALRRAGIPYVDVSQVAVSTNGIELQAREFFSAIRDGGEPNSSVAEVLPCYEVLDRLERQMAADRAEG